MKLPFGKKTATRKYQFVGSILSLTDGFMIANDAATSEEPKPPGFWKSIDWKLMLALLFPVTLETLDYTGMSTSCTRGGVAHSFTGT